MDQGLAANQFVHNNVVLDEQHAVELPARYVHLTFEVQKISPEITRAGAIDGSLFNFEARAGRFSLDAIPYPGIELVGIGCRARDKAAHDIRIVQEGDIRPGAGGQSKRLEVLDRGLIRNDLVEGVLRFFKTPPWPLDNGIATWQKRTASSQTEANKNC